MRARIYFLFTLGLLGLLALPAQGWAIAGGGTSSYGGGGGGGGFSGGGGSGGGGGFSGGGGGFSGGGGTHYEGGGGGFSLFFFIVVFLLISMMVRSSTRERGRIYQRVEARRASRAEIQARAQQAESAALDAAEDDAYFEPSRLEPETVELFQRVQRLWAANDVQGLSEWVGPELMREWSLRLQDFQNKGWSNIVEVDNAHAEVVGVENMEDDGQDRVVLYLQAAVTDYVKDSAGRVITLNGQSSTSVQIAQYWTLAWRGGKWMLWSIEQEAEGSYRLQQPLISRPEDEQATLHGEAVMELAAQSGTHSAREMAELAELTMLEDAEAKLADLMLMDGRFAREPLEESVRRALRAWAEAVDGEDAQLIALAEPKACNALLYPSGPEGRIRRVVRGLSALSMEVVEVHGGDETPQVVVRVSAGGIHYVENRDTLALRSGSRDFPGSLSMEWSFSLRDSESEAPWQLSHVSVWD